MSRKNPQEMNTEDEVQSPNPRVASPKLEQAKSHGELRSEGKADKDLTLQ